MSKTERIQQLEKEVAALKAQMYALDLRSAQGIPMPYPVYPPVIPWQPYQPTWTLPITSVLY